MEIPNKHEQSSSNWKQAELDPDTAQDLKERLSTVPYLSKALNELAENLDEDNSSRTVFRLPINLGSSSVESAMYGTARSVAEVIKGEGVDYLKHSFFVIENDLPESFNIDDVELPAGLKAGFDTTSPIGYMRVEKTESGVQAIAGCLDPATQTNYSETL